MPILHLLQHRRSSKKFGHIAPNEEQLVNILRSALRVPDHGRLKPYHFTVIEHSGMQQFEQCLLSAVTELGLGEEHRKKAHKLSQRAPMVIAVVAKLDHTIEKVPAWEQMLTAGCATYAMQLAANAQGFETSWITGKWVEGRALRTLCGCRERDRIVALVMIGTPQEDCPTEAREPESPEKFVSYIR